MLQATSVLPNSKKLQKNRLQICKSRNLTEEALTNSVFQVPRGPLVPPPRGCAPARRYGRLGLDHRFYLGVVV